jgi:hypothetical protein
MTATQNLPTNKNFLSPLGFRFLINKTPGVNYFVQSVNIPDITLGNSPVPTPFKSIPLAGDHLEYGDLEVRFRVDEELRNYREIFDWITALGFPETFNQYKSIADIAPASGKGAYSDATLTVLSSAKNPIVNYLFKNIYPYALTDLVFDTTLEDVNYIEVTSQFKFETLSVEYLI